MDGRAATVACARASARSGLLVSLAMLITGCASDQQLHDAITAVNKEFQRQYERVLATEGTRVVNFGRARAFDAMAGALTHLDMQVETMDPRLGYLNVYAPAPKPLTSEEWQRAVTTDLPMMREVVRPYVGFLAEFLQFEPDAFDIVINVTIVEQGARSAVSLTMRMREVRRARRSTFPRREYPPPTALRMGIAKIWSAFERELYSEPRGR
jgi:hypothetical protein